MELEPGGLKKTLHSPYSAPGTSSASALGQASHTARVQ